MVGRHGVIGTAEARRRAASIIVRIKLGEEPMPPLAARIPDGPTVANLAERYPEDHVTVNCKPTTARDARSLVYRYILPALGRLPLEAVEPGQVENLHRRLACSPATANKVIKVLLHMYTLADDWWMVEDRFNPCRPVPKYPERKRKRRLSGSELDRLGQMLNDAALRRHIGRSGGNDPSHDRDGMSQERSIDRAQADVGAVQGKIRLSDGKSGLRSVRVSPSTMLMLEALPRREDDPWLFAGRKPGTHMSGIDEAWRTVRELAGLHDVRIHNIRHSIASRALAPGEGLSIVGRPAMVGTRRPRG